MTELQKQQLWIYSFLAFPLAFAELPLFINVPKFYNEYVGLTLSHIGFTLFFVRSFDALKDPILGFLGDYTYRGVRSRYYFMAGFIPLFVVSFIALWNPPQLSYTATLLWFVICLLGVHLADGAIIISYHALGAEVSEDYNDRTRLTSLRESLRILGLLVAAALPSTVAGFYGLPFAFSCFSFLFGFTLVGIFLLFYRKGPDGLLRHTPDTQHRIQYFRTLRNRKFLWILGLHSLNVFAFAIPTTLFAFFVRDNVGVPSLEGVFLIIYFLSGIAGMFVWSWVSQRTTKKFSWFCSLIIGGMALSLALIIQPGDIAFFSAICLVFGMTFGADLALPPSMLADIIDEREDQRQVSTASYFSLWNVTAKLSTALAPGLAFPVLEMWGYGQGSTTPHSLWVLGVIYALIPAILKLLTAIFLFLSPLDRQKEEESLDLEAKTV